MNAESGTTFSNTATGHATVGVQIGAVHGDFTHLQVLPEDPPERVYAVGLEYLDMGVADMARELFDKAWAKGHRGDEVTFHWLLALLSRKTALQLSEADHAQLLTRLRLPMSAQRDAWSDGIDFVRYLLDSGSEPSDDQLSTFWDLGGHQRKRIIQHLEFLARGRLEQQLWDLAVREARDEQPKGNREQRVWKFFEPDPVGPRLRPVRPAAVDGRTWLALWTMSAVFAIASWRLGILVVRSDSAILVALYMMAIAGALVALVNGARWYACHRAVQARRRQLAPHYPQRGTLRPGGFADSVDALFERYSLKYAPPQEKRQRWLAESEGLRRSIRDELVRAYREDRTTSRQIAWLIRHRIKETRTQWETGELRRSTAALAATASTRLVSMAGLAAALLGGVCGVVAAFPENPVTTVFSTLGLAISARLGAPMWMLIVDERARFERETKDAHDVYVRSEPAFLAWKQRLADRPEDTEMASWLDCDRRILMQNAFAHYHLGPADLIAHAFIDAPAPGSERGRSRRAPWRHKRYQLFVFLITEEGVRQVQADLDFTNGTFSNQRRANFRFDAVATVHVSESNSERGGFELGLLDGNPILVPVDTGITEEQPLETSGFVSKVTRDAAGLTNAIHVLEGIAAEGKRWVILEKRRGSERTSDLGVAIRDAKGTTVDTL